RVVRLRFGARWLSVTFLLYAFLRHAAEVRARPARAGGSSTRPPQTGKMRKNRWVSGGEDWLRVRREAGSANRVLRPVRLRPFGRASGRGAGDRVQLAAGGGYAGAVVGRHVRSAGGGPGGVFAGRRRPFPRKGRSEPAVEGEAV